MLLCIYTCLQLNTFRDVEEEEEEKYIIFLLRQKGQK